MTPTSTLQVEHFYPRHPLLKRHIDYYYFLKTDSPDFLSRYYVFPNTLQAFNIHKNATCQINPSATTVQGNQTNNYLMIAQGRHELPLYVELKGILDKITIIFKPLGLNHFITKSLVEVTPATSQVITDWFQHQHCAPFLDAFYQTQEQHQRIDLLEAFLLTIYRPLPDLAVLEQALLRLMDFDNEPSIEAIIQALNLNTRTFNRLFLKHLAISPVHFRKIARFRHSLRNKLFSEHFKSLTEIGYRSNFYDQAYFVKVYQKLTGHNPSHFFSAIDTLADDRLIMKFLQD
jgi:AraC-like DNA-binding protein